MTNTNLITDEIINFLKDEVGVDLFSDENTGVDLSIQESFDAHVNYYNTSKEGKDYKSNNWSEDLQKKHGVPAKFAGYLEDNPELYEDVMLAAKETGTDPAALYTIYMQEGGAHKGIMSHARLITKRKAVNEYVDENPDDYNYRDKFRLPPHEDPRFKNIVYNRDYDMMDTYQDIGLDSFFEDQPLALQRGYLSEEIKGDMHGVYENEVGYRGMTASITMKDALRAIGATMRLNQDYLKGHFKDAGIDFDLLSNEQKTFWTYASINAGHSDTKELFNAYGPTPWENKDFQEARSGATEDFRFWMENVGRVTGGRELLEGLNAFNTKR